MHFSKWSPSARQSSPTFPIFIERKVAGKESAEGRSVFGFPWCHTPHPFPPSVPFSLWQSGCHGSFHYVERASYSVGTGGIHLHVHLHQLVLARAEADLFRVLQDEGVVDLRAQGLELVGGLMVCGKVGVGRDGGGVEEVD